MALRMFVYASQTSQFTSVSKAFADGYTSSTGDPVGVLQAEFNEFSDKAVYEYWLKAFGSPDIIPLYNGAGKQEFIDSGAFLDLTDLWEKHGFAEDTVPAALDYVTGRDGKRYGVPTMATGNLCNYRKSVFAAHDVVPPTTWSELLAACEVFKAAGMKCLGTDLFSIPTSQYFDSLAIRMHGDAFYEQFFMANITLEDPRIRAVFDELVPLFDAGFLSRKDSATYGLEMTWALDFALDPNATAIYCGFDSLAGVVLSAGVSDADVGAFRFPAYDGTRGTASPTEANNGVLSVFVAFASPISSAFHDRSRAILDYIGNATTQKEVLTGRSGVYPLRPSLTEVMTSSRTRLAYDTMLEAEHAFERSGMAAFGYPELLARWQKFIFTLYGQKTSADATALIDAELPQLEAVRLSAVLKQASTPVANPSSGSFSEPISVELTTLTPGAVIHYTIDGSQPNVASPVYTGSVNIALSGVTELRAIAAAPELSNSNVMVSSYQITLAVLNAESTDNKRLLAILLPVFLGICCIASIIGYVVYRRKSVTYKLSSDSDLVIPEKELTVGKAVGAGSYGTVYAGKWRSTAVAVKRTRTKEMSPAQLREFVDEASMLLRLRHSNVVIFMGITLEPPSLVTEFMDRGSMYEVLHSPDLFLDSSILLKWAHNITQGLQYLSHAGVVHGDFKSLNVLFDNNWVPKNL
ncbi:serine/threonine protein kinase [Thecamonas trahens ATCC 50062]|uniref:Serine/threonine protein kinase n=1 Tax=Thecamonas trahens ATCC 50062 TaxID=461836 RepID=A0A0L0D1T7_THETB|nr:serine/threonine protein kinase [Thecamonas trahens ATCC 50062]KNC46232.1 serine/threonine protein kinase [Thecamonas trahens ATCC 50062]|eukprot:XP_013760529.1 serine/threonine protein kinase [Thecamonas trahens ATCC 50062]